MKIVIVGPCAAGTTTLAQNLRALGYDAHPSAQEHSYVPEMWRMTHPDVLIYLDASMAAILRRRDVAWGEAHLATENQRLAHARQHCDLYIATDDLSIEQVLERTVEFLRGREGEGDSGGATDRAPRSSRPRGG
jgi:deoxyadenosine/deoxycytidine kinase